ncbi:MAG TPA: AAA family ATPase [Candidatus Poseidoniaceae archaeon]|nr:AAA family ATPase [Candidatus Poseidoniaceae archaeon]
MTSSKDSHPDWTEKFRPNIEEDLVGNQEARDKIKKWIESWNKGPPKKRSLLLVGPPGVGKTSIARAIALENNWNIIELNASEERNAASIRKAATSGAVNSSLFSYEGEIKRSIILLDEVDHMSGKLRKVSENKIKNNLSNDTSPNEVLSGDTGGKAELLNLISNSREPIILACNDVMRFWGLGSGWRDRKDRFLKNIDLVQFNRVRNSELKIIAKKVLKKEGYTIDGAALERLVSINVGDIRALIKDLQSLALESNGNIDLSDIDKQISIGARDQSIDLFPGLEKLYKSKTAKIAQSIMLNLDKTPDELIAWISWNNARIHNSSEVISNAANYLGFADSILPVMYENNAYKSWYWGSNISALSSGLIGKINPKTKMFLQYPDFLRKNNESWKKNGLLNKISKGLSINHASAKNEFYPLLSAFHNKEINEEWASEFIISYRHGLDFSEHAFLSNLNLSHASTKKLDETFSKKIIVKEIVIKEFEEENDSKEDLPGGQSTLF